MKIHGTMISEAILQLKKIDVMIEQENTGSTLELASKAGMPLEAVYTFLRFLMSQGVRIHFDTRRNTYCYDPNQKELEIAD